MLDTSNKRKSAAITSVIMSLLLVSIFFFGLNYLDPPKEYGIAVNLGTSDVGKGAIQPTKTIKTSTQEKVVEEEIKEVEKVKTVDNTTNVTEKIITQNTEDAIAIKKKKEAKRKAATEARIKKEKLEAIAKKKAQQNAKKKKFDNLMKGLKNSKGTTTGGKGDDTINGNKGKINGNPYAPSYFGNSGSGGKGVGYGLNGRGKPSNKTYKQNCNEYGLVVVKIEVNRDGNVIKAQPGVKGTTNTAPCLLDPAKKIALSYKWPANNNAPKRQIGFVSINFKY